MIEKNEIFHDIWVKFHIGLRSHPIKFTNLKDCLKMKKTGLILLLDGEDCFATVKMGLRSLYDHKVDFMNDNIC